MAEISDLIASTAKRFGLPVDLFSQQVRTESGGNTQAVSPKGALGLAQVMPATAQEMGYTAMDMLDPAKNLEAGAKYMRRMLTEAKRQNPSLSGKSLYNAALAAYNAGPGGASEFIKTGDISTLPAETRNYIQKIGGGSYVQAAQAKTPGRNLLAGVDIKALKTQTPGRNLVKEESLIQKAASAAESGFEKLTGGLEALASMATGATTGAVAYGTGALEGIAKSALEGKFGTQEGVRMAEETAAKRAGQYTFQPRTVEGQRQLAAVGQVAEQLMPITPIAGEIQTATQAARPATAAAARQAGAAARQAATPVIHRAQQIAQPIAAGAADIAAATGRGAAGVTKAVAAAPRNSADLFREMLTGQPSPAKSVAAVPSASAIPGATGGGAEAVTAAAQKQARAATLPVPIEFTESQLASGPEALAAKQWEQTALHTAGEAGDILREHASTQRLNAAQNIERFLDDTGAMESTPRGVGVTFDKALQGRYRSEKAKVNSLYTAARNSEEARQPVDTNLMVSIGEGDNAINNSLIGYLNTKVRGLPSSGVTDTARQLMIKMGLAQEDANGQLISRPATVGAMEDFRKELSGTAKWDDRVGVREETILKKIIDAQTQPAEGVLYKRARSARQNLGRDFEDRSLVKRLLSTKPNSDDRFIAYEDVLDNVVLSEATSLDSMRHVRRLVLTSGEEGKQAWREIQGGTVRWLGDQLVSPTQRDANGAPVLTPARFAKQVTRLDQSGKLDYLFGKQGAQQMRTLAEAVVDLIPAQGTVNTSGTAYTLAGMVGDMAATTILTGMPAPAITIIKMLRQNRRQAQDIARARRSVSAGKLQKQ